MRSYGYKVLIDNRLQRSMQVTCNNNVIGQWVNGSMDGQTDRPTDRWMDGWMDGWIDSLSYAVEGGREGDGQHGAWGVDNMGRGAWGYGNMAESAGGREGCGVWEGQARATGREKRT